MNASDEIIMAGIFLCIIFFAGEPDLMDAIIQFLMSKAGK